MSRRKLVALISAAFLLAVFLGVVALVVGVTQTGTGQDYIRHVVHDQLEPRLNGKLYVGRISGSFFDGVTIDSVELRGPDDSLVAAVSRIRVWYDVRDLIDKRVLVRRLEIERPVVHLTQYEDNRWNYKLVLKPTPAGPPRTVRGWGDFIVADSVRLHGGQFILTLPWHPADSLRGARRDSAIAFNIARKDATIRRRADGLGRTYRWTGIDLALTHMSLAEPDSAAKTFAIGRLNVDESDPPFVWRNVRGAVRIEKDTLAARVAHFDLPGSTGTGTARVVWGSNLPTRYDVRVVGDSVSLNDVAWVYPTLPRTGGGTMLLHIVNDPKNLRVLQYALTKVDVRTVKSHLTGDVTFAVGGPVLAVKDVSMAAQPVDWDFLRVINGKAFPYDFQGTLTGTVRGRGGPVNRFVIDEAHMTYADAHVPGAVSRFNGRGMVDILFPAYTVFRGFDLDVDRLDLRTPRALNKNFPPLGGWVEGRARLDSLWLDVRVSNADITHHDGPDAPNHFTGGGRVTIGDKFLTYDLALDASPLSLTTIARSYPFMPARGTLSGPMELKGTVDDLFVKTTLAGDAGTLMYEGMVDSYEPSYALRGRGAATGLDLRSFLGAQSAPAGSAASKTPATSLTFHFDSDVRGATLADLAGTLSFDLARSTVDHLRLYGGAGRLGFESGRLRVDSLDVESTAFMLSARGGLGLAPQASDTLRLAVTVDSLGGLRRYLASADTTVVDSLAGTLRLNGTLVGTIDTSAAALGLRLAARVRGDGLVLRGMRALALDGDVTVDDVLRRPFTTARLGADSVGVGRLAFVRADATYTTDSGSVAAPTWGAATGAVTAGHFAMRATSDSGPTLALAGHSAISPDTTRVVLDTMRLGITTAHGYRLTAPATVTMAAANNVTSVDALVLRDEIGAQFSVGGLLQDSGAVSGALAVDRVPLVDLARLGGLVGHPGSTPYDGRLSARATVSGTRAAPIVDARAWTGTVQVAGVTVDSIGLDTRYAAQKLDGDLTLFRGGLPLLTANAALPVDLALVPRASRQLGDTLRGALRADSLDLALLGALVPGVQNVAGVVRASADLRGTFQHPLLFGALRLRGGAANVVPGGLRLQDITADVALSGDSLRVDSVYVRSTGTATLKGLVTFAPLRNPTLDFRFDAHNFLAVDRARLATLWISTPTTVTLRGPYLGATLRGSVRADRGRIYIPELIEKRIVDLNDYRDVVDTSALATRSLLPGAPSAFVENLTVEDVSVGVGDDVWLRSPEANIKLGGSLAVTRARATQLGGRSREQLALRGALAVERGTYRLSLPPIAAPIFEVQPGTLRFFGEPDLNPTLDVRAIHTVRQVSRGTNRPDVRVQVAIGGTLNSPSLSLSSPDDPSIATTDLISYLVTGEPAAVVLGQQGGASGAEQAVALGLRLVGSYASGALTEGGPFDVVQVETVSSSDPGSGTSVLSSGRSILERTRLGVGGQLGEKTFYTFSTGLCGLGIGGSSNDFRLFRRNLGFKIEHRLSPIFSFQFGLEPGSQTQACNPSITSSVLQTPPQGGFDFLRQWSF
jgi:translocation and assembly module TamB